MVCTSFKSVGKGKNNHIRMFKKKDRQTDKHTDRQISNPPCLKI